MASESRVAIVTGAAQGLGLAISEALLKEGYKVCLTDVNETKGRESVVNLQAKYTADKVMFIKCDVTSETNFEDAFSKTKNAFGRIDLLVNNAGMGNEYDPVRTLQINLLGPIIGCQLALKFMGISNGGKGGVVINVASIAGLLSSPYMPVYCASKHGVVGLTRAYGDKYHLDSSGVYFMAVCPNAIRTPMLNSVKFFKETKDIITVDIMEPEFVAQGVIKHLQDKKNGSTLLVNPGNMMYIGLPRELEEIKL